MPTSLYVPGPAAIALGTSGGTMSFLGWSRDGVTPREEIMYVPAMTDYAGPMLPADHMFAGKAMTVTMALTDYDPIVFQNVFRRFASGTLGAIAPNEIGTLIYSEGQSFQLMIKAMRQPLVTRYANYVPGFRLPSCWINGTIEFPIATNPQVIPISFYAWNNITKATMSGTVWDMNMTGFPALT